MNKKYGFTGEEKYGLKQIVALRDFGSVKKGEIGGWIEGEKNLCQVDNAWVFDNARIYGDARVFGYARLYGDAEVYDDAMVCDNAWVYGDAKVRGDALVYGDASVCGDSEVYGDAEVCGDALVRGDAYISKKYHYCTFGGFGRSDRTTTLFKTKESHTVSSGCFIGTLSEFEEAVKNTHDDSILGEEYKAIIEVMKIRIKRWEDE